MLWTNYYFRVIGGLINVILKRTHKPQMNNTDLVDHLRFWTTFIYLCFVNLIAIQKTKTQ